MFPDLTRDDIFRLETKRLWLRWPRAADAPAIAVFAALAETAEMTATIPNLTLSGEAEGFVLASRAGNCSGKALVLALTQKGTETPAIGLVSAAFLSSRTMEVGYVLAPCHWGKGFASEAARALIGMVFGFTNVDRIIAKPRALSPAARRVLEKCGFVPISDGEICSGSAAAQAQGALPEEEPPRDRFQLDRKMWGASRWSRHMPAMVHQFQGAGDQAGPETTERQPQF